MAASNLDNFVKWVTEGVKSPLYTPELLEKIYHELIDVELKSDTLSLT